MKKTGIFLAIVGSLIGIGIILSVYGNLLIFEDLNQGEGEVFLGQDFEIEIELDNKESQTGIYAVQITEFEKAEIYATIIDPFNSAIEQQRLSQEVFEGNFEIRSSGTYKLIIENRGEMVKIFAVIGSEPDSGKMSLNLISIIVLMMGLFGMIGLAIFLIINRRRKVS